MALRGLLRTIDDTVQFSMTEVAVPGNLVAYAKQTNTASNNQARLSTSGLFYDGPVEADPVVPIGVLLDTVVAALTNATTNFFGVGGAGNSTYITDTSSNAIFMNSAGARYVGEKVAIHRKGLITTDRLFPGILPSGGDYAYSASGGLIGDGSSQGAGLSGIIVGRFESPKDADGYAAVYIDVDAAYLPYRHYASHS